MTAQAKTKDQKNPKSKTLKYLDLTFGRGGHFSAMFQHFPQLQSLALDADPEAIAYGKKAFAQLLKEKRLSFRQANYSSFQPKKEEEKFDFILMDLGLSSPQLEKAERGFSFYQKGPLDMRINPQGESLSAKDILESFSQEELIQLFQVFGEQKQPYRVVKAIVRQRQKKNLSTTTELANLIEAHEKKFKRGSPPSYTLLFSLKALCQ